MICRTLANESLSTSNVFYQFTHPHCSLNTSFDHPFLSIDDADVWNDTSNNTSGWKSGTIQFTSGYSISVGCPLTRCIYANLQFVQWWIYPLANPKYAFTCFCYPDILMTSSVFLHYTIACATLCSYLILACYGLNNLHVSYWYRILNHPNF